MSWSHLQSTVKSANYAVRQEPQTAGARWDSVTRKRPGAKDAQVKTHTHAVRITSELSRVLRSY